MFYKMFQKIYRYDCFIIFALFPNEIEFFLFGSFSEFIEFSTKEKSLIIFIVLQKSSNFYLNANSFGFFTISKSDKSVGNEMQFLAIITI